MVIKDGLVALAAVAVIGFAGCKSEPQPPSAEQVAAEVVKQMEAKAELAASQEQEAAARLGSLEKGMEDIQAEVNRLMKAKEQAFSDLLAAKADTAKAQAKSTLEKTDAALKSKMDELKALRGKDSTSTGATIVKCDPNDPLCGL